jgi:5-methylcytosine-specific restriction endonuclease McrA
MYEPAKGRLLPKKTIKALKERSQGHCEYQYPGCTGNAQEIDHIKSRARMGSHELHNLAHICRACHDKKTKNDPISANHRTHAWQPEGTGEDEKPVKLKRPDGTEFQCVQ